MQRRIGLMAMILVGLSSVTDVQAQRLDPHPVKLGETGTLEAMIQLDGDGDGRGGLAGSCDAQISAHTNADFEGGTYVLQGGFAEDEIAAVSFTLPESAFPIKVDLVEMIFGTSSAPMVTAKSRISR